MTIPSYTFSNGLEIPAIGFGTVILTGENTEKALEIAIKCGYRHIDTAFCYGNEEKIGNVLQRLFKDGTVKRSEMFITTKLHAQFHHKEDVEPILKKQMGLLKVDYIDLYLIHRPVPIKKVEGDLFPMKDGAVMFDTVDHLETWKAMEEVYKKGYIKSIGLSNFSPSQIKRIYDNASVKPHNLQLLCHAYWPQEELYHLCKQLNIIMTAYGPLGSPGFFSKISRLTPNPNQFQDSKPKSRLLDDVNLTKIASNYGKTPAQVLLRWLVQLGIIPIPKSVDEQRIKENLNIFDFNLSDKDFQIISNLPIRDRLFGVADKVFKDHPQFCANEPY